MTLLKELGVSEKSYDFLEEEHLVVIPRINGLGSF